MQLTNKNIIVAVSGSIAAYKSPDIVRKLQDLSANVKVVLTSGGEKFITKLTLETISKNPVFNNLWDSSMQHITLAKWADLILIAPASANIIAQITHGKTENLLENLILASTCPIMISPTMNCEMLSNKATQNNLEILQSRGIKIIQSDIGKLACDDFGKGKMPDANYITNEVAKQFKTTKLTGKKIIITAGGTIEKIDPVRYISNFSSGKMAMAMAQNCVEMGASVLIIYANITVELVAKVQTIYALSADEMLSAVMDNINNCDIFISCAAICDFKVKTKNQQKTKKAEVMTLELIKNTDILQSVAALRHRPFCVGFAAETQNLLQNATTKLQHKKLDIIVANNANQAFASDENEVVVIDKNQAVELTSASKYRIAQQIMQIIANHFKPYH